MVCVDEELNYSGIKRRNAMNAQGLYDIYGVWYVPVWYRPWFLWTVVGIGMVLFFLCAWYLIKRYRRKKKEEVPYWRVYVEQLSTLKQQNVATVERGRVFYGILTPLLKQYLHQRYGYDVTRRTDDETVTFLEQQQFNPQYLAQLKEIFQGGVYIKFANAQAVQQQIEKDLENSIRFINNSKLP
jgi:hypothetical protein